MKLLFVIPEYLPHPGGGIATFYKNLLPYCVADGHSVRVVLASPYMQGTEHYVVDGVHVEQLDPERFERQLTALRRFAIFPELQRYLAAAWAAWEQADRGEGYDFVEATDFGLTFVPWVVTDTQSTVQVQMHSSNGQIDSYDPREGFQLQAGVVRLIESALLRR